MPRFTPMSDYSAYAPQATEDRPPASGTAEVSFLGSRQAYLRLVARGTVLSLLTLGVYSFWLATDMRRYLWGHTEIGGDTLEYTGRALRLLSGLLLALTLMVPVSAGLVYVTLELGLPGEQSSVIALVLLAWLVQLARYRGRRYRLNHTFFRGVRFQHTGTAWRYAFRAISWWIVVALTLGLAYPWARAGLERYKLRNSFYGDLPGWFQGSSLGLFARGFLLWLATLGPFFAGLYLALRNVNWDLLMAAVTQGGGEMLARIEASNPGIAKALLAVGGTFVWVAVIAVLLYPAFRAMVLRWWLSGITFGVMKLRSRLRTSRVYGIYLRFAWLSIVLAVCAGLFAGGVLALMGYLLEQGDLSKLAETIAIAILVGGCVIFVLAFFIIYQVEVKLALWRELWESLEFSGIHTLERVRVIGELSSALGEGSADARHAGDA
jgi:uncharacterized membrane protein YjgN (DUF898 family)